MVKNILLVAGESSGDIAASQLITAVRKQHPNDVAFYGIAGDLSQAAGMTLNLHCKDMAVMGLTEIIKQIRYIRKGLRFCKKTIQAGQPNLIILVDYPGFNMRIARLAKQHNIPVLYYISPKVWAWKPSRIHQLKRSIDHMAVIFPFEVPLYQQQHIPVSLVQHPSVEQSKPTCSPETFYQRHNIPENSTCITIMPGSRKSEIRQHLNTLITTAKYAHAQYPELHFLLPVANTIEPTSIKQAIPSDCQTYISIIIEDQYNAIAASKLVVAASGTAALEVGLIGTPLCVLYKTSWLTYQLGKRLIRVPYISLPNLIANQKIIEEFIQHDASPERICAWICKMHTSTAHYNVLHNNIQKVRFLLNEHPLSTSIAECVQHMLTPSSS